MTGGNSRRQFVFLAEGDPSLFRDRHDSEREFAPGSDWRSEGQNGRCDRGPAVLARLTGATQCPTSDDDGKDDDEAGSE
jgi:hypothetical protein